MQRDSVNMNGRRGAKTHKENREELSPLQKNHRQVKWCRPTVLTTVFVMLNKQVEYFLARSVSGAEPHTCVPCMLCSFLFGSIQVSSMEVLTEDTSSPVKHRLHESNTR